MCCRIAGTGWVFAAALTAAVFGFEDPVGDERALMMLEMLLVSISAAASVVAALGRIVVPISEAMRHGYELRIAHETTAPTHKAAVNAGAAVFSLRDRR